MKWVASALQTDFFFFEFLNKMDGKGNNCKQDITVLKTINSLAYENVDSSFQILLSNTLPKNSSS